MIISRFARRALQLMGRFWIDDWKASIHIISTWSPASPVIFDVNGLDVVIMVWCQVVADRLLEAAMQRFSTPITAFTAILKDNRLKTIMTAVAWVTAGVTANWLAAHNLPAFFLTTIIKTWWDGAARVTVNITTNRLVVACNFLTIVRLRFNGWETDDFAAVVDGWFFTSHCVIWTTQKHKRRKHESDPS